MEYSSWMGKLEQVKKHQKITGHRVKISQEIAECCDCNWIYIPLMMSESNEI